jgi:hypothetical protein
MACNLKTLKIAFKGIKMGNCIQLRTEINFGRFKGCTGAELLKSNEGTEYLVWVYEKTDIPLESSIYCTLVSLGLIEPGIERVNSDVHRARRSQGTQLDCDTLTAANFAKPDYKEIYSTVGQEYLQMIMNEISNYENLEGY